MRSFLRRIFIFTLPMVFVSYPLDLIISNFISKHSSTSFNADEFSIWNDIFGGGINADIVVYGSSRAWVQFNTNLISDSLNYNSYNFGVDGHCFDIQYLRHKIYLKYNPEPKIIIISVDPFTLQSRKDLFNYPQFLPYMLWDKDIKKYTSYFVGFNYFDYYIPLVRYVGEFNVFRNAILQYLGFEEFQAKRENGFFGAEREWADDLDEAKRKMKSYKVEFNERNVGLFETFLQECKNKNIKVLMVYAPFYFEGLDFIENHNEVLDVFKNFSSKYGFGFLDYSRDSISYNKSYFYNSAHMNKKGADLFTKKLIENIRRSDIFEQ